MATSVREQNLVQKPGRLDKSGRRNAKVENKVGKDEGPD
jgi:hypothetical protein